MCAVGVPMALRGFIVHEKNLRRHCAVVVDHVLVISSYLLDTGQDIEFFEFERLRLGRMIKKSRRDLK